MKGLQDNITILTFNILYKQYFSQSIFTFVTFYVYKKIKNTSISFFYS